MNQPNLFNETEPAFGDELDFYETPEWAVEAVLPFIPGRETPWDIIEPAAGRGALLGPFMAELEPRSVFAVELHPGRFVELRGAFPNLACVRADFLTLDFTAALARLVVMNPPYSMPRKNIGLEFVEKALQVAGPLGAVVALLPLDFATGVERCERVHDHHVCSVYPLRRRPHFGGPHSGARPFAWFAWDRAEPKNEWKVIG